MAQYGWTTLGQLGAFAGAVYVGLALVLLVVYPAILALNGLNPIKFFHGAWPSTRSSTWAARPSTSARPWSRPSSPSGKGILDLETYGGGVVAEPVLHAAE